MMLEKAREDVRYCLSTWTQILRAQVGSGIEYAYSKGSAVGVWESRVDYVPILSDVDIHVKLNMGNGLIPTHEDPFAWAMDASKQYEDLFVEKNPGHLHIPRTQIVILNELEKEPNYVPPRQKDVCVLLGVPPERAAPSTRIIRKIDAEQLRAQQIFLDHLPMSIFDRSGLDYWITVRQMNWRVGPSPVRLLTQTHPDPLEVWSWNRSRVCAQLQDMGLSDLTKVYRSFYETGWSLFESGFQNTEGFRNLITDGYNVLKSCVEELDKMHDRSNQRH